MSRRDSRGNIAVRQNDALLEFENFKKKFLLANKHITKLNSTLSIRIEELNMQISTLYAENLRLRASEIALSSQLKREREKSRKIMSDAENATMNLMKHFGVLRHSLAVPDGLPTPSPPSKRQQPAQQPVRPLAVAVEPSVSPVTRLSRAPNVPGIYEEDEEEIEQGLPFEAEHDDSPSVTRRTSSESNSKATKPRPSTSRLPIPMPGPAPHIDLLEMQAANVIKRKAPTRRQSGLLTTSRANATLPASMSLPRPPSPAFGSPIRLEAALAAENEEMEVVALVQNDHVDQEPDMVRETNEEAEARRERRERKKRAKEKEAERERERESTAERDSERERKRVKEDDDAAEDNNNMRLRDVTNSPRRLSPLDTGILSDREAQTQTPPSTSHSPSSSLLTPISSSTPPTTPTQPIPTSSTIPSTSSSSALHSLSVPSQTSQSESEMAGGRERRTRKSVNYAEPKLNTKMRKPDPSDVFEQRRSHSPNPSSAGESALNGAQLSPPPPRRPSSASSITVKRKKPPPVSSSSAAGRLHLMMEGEDDEDSEGAQADSEYGGPRSATGWVNVEGRRRSVQSGSGRDRERDKERADAEEAGRRHSLAT